MAAELRWLAVADQKQLAADGTDAFRLADSRDLWVERFGPAALISSAGEIDVGALADETRRRCSASIHGPLQAVYHRRLVKGPGKHDRPVPVVGALQEDRCLSAEAGLLFEVDFSAGYSVGLFPDQRSNRAWIRGLRPARVLNTFAFTCAFSVAAASAGSQTLSVDLAKAALQRGRRNFELNGVGLEGHRFLADDTFDVLPRLARRGETFDAIILDPPTFSRGRGGRIFRAGEHMADLLGLALPIAAKGAAILVSTNYSSLSPAELAGICRSVLPRGSTIEPAKSELDFPASSGASVVRVRLP
ncbi:MAG: class I SAM-dependent rRNA methyltransferase [Terrimicrobiaceae bacterium]